MAGIGKTGGKIVPKELRKYDHLGEAVRKEGISTFESLNPKVEAGEEAAVIPLADEEELARVRRRQRRSGGRASTVLTDDEKLGG